MDTTAAQIQSIQLAFCGSTNRDRPHEQELVEHDLSVVEVAFGEGVSYFEIERGERFRLLTLDFRSGKCSDKSVNCQRLNLFSFFFPFPVFQLIGSKLKVY